MLNYLDEKEPTVFDEPQTSFTMYQVKHDQDLERIRCLAPYRNIEKRYMSVSPLTTTDSTHENAAQLMKLSGNMQQA